MQINGYLNAAAPAYRSFDMQHRAGITRKQGFAQMVQITNQTDKFVQPSWGKSLSFDTPKMSDGSPFADFTEDEISAKAQELASLMTETPTGVEINLVRGMSISQLANLIGGIGKQIDDALTAGDITEQEYADLNNALLSYSSFMTEKAETKNAMVHVLRQTDDAIRDQFGRGASDEEVENYVEKIRGTWNDRINEFLKDNSYDRTILDQMIAAVRDGRSLSFDRKA